MSLRVKEIDIVATTEKIVCDMRTFLNDCSLQWRDLKMDREGVIESLRSNVSRGLMNSRDQRDIEKRTDAVWRTCSPILYVRFNELENVGEMRRIVKSNLSDALEGK